MVILTKKRYRRDKAIELGIAGSGVAIGAAGIVIGSCAMAKASKAKSAAEKNSGELDIQSATMRKRVAECSRAIEEIQSGLHDQLGWRFGK